MKKITAMTHDEVITLHDSDITRLIDIACAEAGVPLQDQPPVAPAKPEYTDVFNSYKIVEIVFKTRESAEALQDCLRKNLRNILRLNYFEPLERHLAIEDYIFVTDDDKRDRDKVEKIYLPKLAYYQALKGKYDIHMSNRLAIEEPILAAYRDAMAKEAVRQMLQREAVKYLDLAEYNIDIAENFLRKAFPEALEKVKDIFNVRAYMTAIDFEIEEAKCPPSKS